MTTPRNIHTFQVKILSNRERDRYQSFKSNILFKIFFVDLKKKKKNGGGGGGGGGGPFNMILYFHIVVVKSLTFLDKTRFEQTCSFKQSVGTGKWWRKYRQVRGQLMQPSRIQATRRKTPGMDSLCQFNRNCFCFIRGPINQHRSYWQKLKRQAKFRNRLGVGQRGDGEVAAVKAGRVRQGG